MNCARARYIIVVIEYGLRQRARGLPNAYKLYIHKESYESATSTRTWRIIDSIDRIEVVVRLSLILIEQNYDYVPVELPCLDLVYIYI